MWSGIDLTHRQARLGLAAFLLVGLIASACTPTSTPGGAPGSSGSSGATSSGQAGVPSSMVLVDGAVTVVKGAELTPICNGVPAARVNVDRATAPTVPPSTTGVMADGEQFTVCAPEPFTPKTPVQPGLTPAKTRIYYTNSGQVTRGVGLLSLSLVTAGSVKAMTISRESGVIDNPQTVVLPGESATWEVAYALPAQQTVLTPFVYEGNKTGFALPVPPAVPGAQAPPSLPATTPVFSGEPTLKPGLEPGMTMTAGWSGFVDKDVPHTCGKKATGVVRQGLDDGKTAIVVTPGDTAVVVPPDPTKAVFSYRVTLCPPVSFTPTPSTFPQGDYEYRQFTAYRTSVATDLVQSGPREIFVSVTNAQGATVAPPVGRVLDPAVVPYADRAKAKAGTVMWTFALAFPKTGGPYFMKTEAGVDILWELT